MYVLAVTGGIGAGKSTAVDLLRSKGAVVISLDESAKRLLVPGTPVHAAVVEEFGEEILGEDGAIDTAALARLAFATPERAARLNAIVHPALVKEIGPGLTEMALLQNPPRVVVLDVPLLVEAPVFAALAGEVLAISAPEEERVGRAMARGMTEEEVRARIACQASDQEREAMADHIIVNDGTLEEFREEVDRFWHEVVEHGSR